MGSVRFVIVVSVASSLSSDFGSCERKSIHSAKDLMTRSNPRVDDIVIFSDNNKQ
jgi:hypothetical protein